MRLYDDEELETGCCNSCAEAIIDLNDREADLIE